MDTNVFISYLDEEYGRKITDFLEYYSGEVFKRTLSCEFSIIISDLTIEEMLRKGKVSEGRLKTILKNYQTINKLEILYPDAKDYEQALYLGKERGIHHADALHAVLSKKAGATLITWNLKDFNPVKDWIEVKSPKEL